MPLSLDNLRLFSNGDVFLHKAVNSTAAWPSRCFYSLRYIINSCLLQCLNYEHTKESILLWDLLEIPSKSCSVRVNRKSRGENLRICRRNNVSEQEQALLRGHMLYQYSTSWKAFCERALWRDTWSYPTLRRPGKFWIYFRMTGL